MNAICLFNFPFRKKNLRQISHLYVFFLSWTEQKFQNFWDWHNSEKDFVTNLTLLGFFLHGEITWILLSCLLEDMKWTDVICLTRLSFVRKNLSQISNLLGYFPLWINTFLLEEKIYYKSYIYRASSLHEQSKKCINFEIVMIQKKNCHKSHTWASSPHGEIIWILVIS